MTEQFSQPYLQTDRCDNCSLPASDGCDSNVVCILFSVGVDLAVTLMTEQLSEPCVSYRSSAEVCSYIEKEDSLGVEVLGDSGDLRTSMGSISNEFLCKHDSRRCCL